MQHANPLAALTLAILQSVDPAFAANTKPAIKNLEMTEDKTGGWEATGAYLLAYAMPLKKIRLTGKRESKVATLSADGFDRGEPDFPKANSLQKAASVREGIRLIESSTESSELIRIQ